MATDLKRNRSVDADMERVFGTGPSLLAPPADGADGDPAPASPPAVDRADGPAPRRWLLIAAPVIVALFVIALAIRFGLTLVPDAPAPVQDTGRIRPAVLDAGVPAPTLTPAPAQSPAPTEDALAPDDFGPAPIERAPDAPPTPTAADVRRSAGPTSTTRPRPPASSAAGCVPGSTEDRCIFADVMAADRRLRAAWARATQAGVPNSELVPLRRSWTRARGISLDSPDETIRRYDALAAALDDLVETEQR